MKWIKINKDKTIWHKWFAWFPVVTKTYDDGNIEYTWLKYVNRCIKYEYGMFGTICDNQYKEIKGIDNETC